MKQLKEDVLTTDVYFCWWQENSYFTVAAYGARFQEAPLTLKIFNTRYQKDAITSPSLWQVGGFNRHNARLISQINGRPLYGGTINDASLVRYLEHLRKQGFKIMLYPLIFIDQIDKPWRGRLTGAYEDVVLFFNKPNGYKNFISLAKSIALSKKLRSQFSLVCFGGGEITKQELFQLNEIGFPLDDLVYRNGDDSALSWYYKNASALVVPSHYEGFGIPLLEAMSLRCPIACSNISSLPEIAGNAAAYFNPWEVDSIIDCLENIVFSPSQLEILSDAGESRINNFSWDKCAKETSEAYKALK
jgi:glycosyltransferase involved in cell wall biosynthesis